MTGYAAVSTKGVALAAGNVVMIRNCDFTKLIPADSGGVARTMQVVAAGVAPDNASDNTCPATVAVRTPIVVVNTEPGAGAFARIA